MTLAPAFLDELRARVAVSTVVARRVKLSRAGREMKGCCPFHNEKSPSFFVNDDKGFYHCFGCGAHGDVIRFIVEQEGLGFIDAVKSLAAEAGLALPEETPEARQRAQAAEGLHDVTGKAAAWFSSQLRDAGGSTARDYLAKRGLADKTIADFALGYSPDSRTRLRTALASVGDAKLIETGLLIQPEAEGNTKPGDPYDRFRGRLMFPIRDPRGRVIGFGGRILGAKDSGAQPKYLNSPDTPLFDKGRTLYNLDRAGPVARKSQRLIVVEGYMDVIGLAQAGFADAVAPLGTALTEAQLGLMWRVVPEPVLCFDGDAAGQRAGLRAALRALPLLEPGRSLRFATLPEGKDPDDIVRESGAAAFEAILAAAEPLYEIIWRSITDVDASTPERRAGIEQALKEQTKQIVDGKVRTQYEVLFRDRFWERFEKRGRRGEIVQLPFQSKASQEALKVPTSVHETTALVVGILNYPSVLSDSFEEISKIPLLWTRHQVLVQAIVDALAWNPDLGRDDILSILDAQKLGDSARFVADANRLPFSFTHPTKTWAEAERDLRFFMAKMVQIAELGNRLGQASIRVAATHKGPLPDDLSRAYAEDAERIMQSLKAERTAVFEELYEYMQQHRDEPIVPYLVVSKLAQGQRDTSSHEDEALYERHRERFRKYRAA